MKVEFIFSHPRVERQNTCSLCARKRRAIPQKRYDRQVATSLTGAFLQPQWWWRDYCVPIYLNKLMANRPFLSQQTEKLMLMNPLTFGVWIVCLGVAIFLCWWINKRERARAMQHWERLAGKDVVTRHATERYWLEDVPGEQVLLLLLPAEREKVA